MSLKKAKTKRADAIVLDAGQVAKREAQKPNPTRESRVLAAINSGKGLPAAAKEASEADTLGFDDQHLEALIGLLEAQIENRQQMLRALEAHYNRRRN